MTSEEDGDLVEFPEHRHHRDGLITNKGNDDEVPRRQYLENTSSGENPLCNIDELAMNTHSRTTVRCHTDQWLHRVLKCTINMFPYTLLCLPVRSLTTLLLLVTKLVYFPYYFVNIIPSNRL